MKNSHRINEGIKLNLINANVRIKVKYKELVV